MVAAIAGKYQENRTLNAPAAAARMTASGTILARVQRARPKPWVQAYRKVPVSSSRASTGAREKAPISAGTTCSKTAMASAVDQCALSKSTIALLQASELAGWHAATAA